MPPKLRNAVVCFSGTFEAPVATLQKWTEANGGTFERKLTPSTTHLVVSEVNWRAQVPEVQTALANGTKVIDYEWFDDKLRITGRVTENKYLWTTIDAERLKQEAKDARAAERVKKRAEKEKEKKKKDAERINYADAFMQHTNEVAHISDEGSGEEEEDGSSSEETSTAKQHSALAEQFAKGAKQAKEDLMSDNHHIYMDVTGFSYDIVVTKASVELSQLDRARITLYESNASPHTYAVYVKIPAYIPVSNYDITTVNDVNFPTAFKCLRENFKVFTGVEWDARVKKFSDRSSLAPLPSARMTVVAPGKNSPPGKLSKINKTGKTNAKAEAEDPEAKKKRLEAAFAASKYRYRLPAEGEPRGTMADGSHYTHQDNKSVYDLFGEAADRSHEVIAAREAFKEEVERLKKLELRKQMRKSGQNKQAEPVEVVVIDSDDEEDEHEDEESEEEEDEEMEDGYVVAKGDGRDVDMQVNGRVDSTETAVEQDYIMVDAATTQT